MRVCTCARRCRPQMQLSCFVLGHGFRYMAGGDTKDPDTGEVMTQGWISKYAEKEGWNETEKDAELSKRYLTAYYWAVTSLTTVGYGDITAHTNIEKCLAVLVLMSGGVAFGLLCGPLIGPSHSIQPGR